MTLELLRNVLRDKEAAAAGQKAAKIVFENVLKSVEIGSLEHRVQRMSTNAAIAVKVNDSFFGVYVHSDGYPEWTGKRLVENYNSQELAERLVGLGHISLLGERIDPAVEHAFEKPDKSVTVFYGRDRGEAKQDAIKCSTVRSVVRAFSTAEWIYVFQDGAWSYSRVSCERRIALQPLCAESAATAETFAK